MIDQAMHSDRTFSIMLGRITSRCPYLDSVSESREPMRDLPRVIGNSAKLWWVLTGDYVPVDQQNGGFEQFFALVIDADLSSRGYYDKSWLNTEK